MSDPDEIIHLRAQVEQLIEENAALRETGFRGSKAEALMALEYDRIPNIMKTPQAIALQRKTATAIMIIVPLILLTVVIGGAVDAYRDHLRSAELRQLDAKLESDFRPSSSQP